MRGFSLLLLLVFFAGLRFGAETSAPPTLEEVRKQMGIPSSGSERGQVDAVGFASNKAQMEAVFKAAEVPPLPKLCASLAPSAGIGEAVAGVICPHDDYVYAGRVYRIVTPRVTAPLVIIAGVFHHYRQFACTNRLVFEDYTTWRSPDGPITVSPLRNALLEKLPPADYTVSDAMHDSEHSVEAIAYWIKHQNPKAEILPFLVPEMGPARINEVAGEMSRAFSAIAAAKGLVLGKDYQVVISADAVHYGSDFDYTPFGEGGAEAYTKAVAQDLAIMQGPLKGTLKPEAVFAAMNDPEKPERRRVTWCGRFSIPFGLAFLQQLAQRSGANLEAIPVAYSTSVGWPELKPGSGGPGRTAPSNLYHFVGYPGVVITMTQGHP